jgi:hypothetical protein
LDCTSGTSRIVSTRDEPQYKRCHCPVWFRTNRDGKQTRGSSKERSWEAAQRKARRLEQAEPSGHNIHNTRATGFADVIEAFLTDKEKGHSLRHHAFRYRTVARQRLSSTQQAWPQCLWHLARESHSALLHLLHQVAKNPFGLIPLRLELSFRSSGREVHFAGSGRRLDRAAAFRARRIAARATERAHQTGSSEESRSDTPSYEPCPRWYRNDGR